MGQAYKSQIKVSEPLYGKPVINNIDLVNTYIDFNKNYFKNE